MPNNSEANAIRERAIAKLDMSRGLLEHLTGGMTRQQLITRAGGKGNHALWIMGHIADTDDLAVTTMTGKTPCLPEQYAKLFRTGTEPVDNPSDYPSADELQDALRTTREAHKQMVREMSDEAAYAPTPEMLRPIAPEGIDLPFTLAMHELFHTGQIASVRSSLGLPRMLM